MACRGESTCLCGLETSEASVNAKRKCKKTELKMIRNSFIFYFFSENSVHTFIGLEANSQKSELK